MIIAAALIEGAALFALVIMFSAGGVINDELVKSNAKPATTQVEQK